MESFSFLDWIPVMFACVGVISAFVELIFTMISFFSNMGKPLSYEEKLKEFVGHTPLQVLAGALLGILIAVIYCFALG